MATEKLPHVQNRNFMPSPKMFSVNQRLEQPESTFMGNTLSKETSQGSRQMFHSSSIKSNLKFNLYGKYGKKYNKQQDDENSLIRENSKSDESFEYEDAENTGETRIEAFSAQKSIVEEALKRNFSSIHRPPSIEETYQGYSLLGKNGPTVVEDNNHLSPSPMRMSPK